MRNLILLILIGVTLIVGACATTPETTAVKQPRMADKIYQDGKTALANGDYDNAGKYFKSLEINYPDSPYTHQAQMELAYAYFKSSDYSSAIATSERFIRNYPDNGNLDYAYYLRGLASFEQATSDLTEDAPLDDSQALSMQTSYQYFTELAERFPDSKYTQDSHKRMAFLQEKLAAHEVELAKQAIQEENYASAAIHARTVIEQYPDSVASGEAETIANMANHLMDMDSQSSGTMMSQSEEPQMAAMAGTETMGATAGMMDSGPMDTGRAMMAEPAGQEMAAAAEMMPAADADGINRAAWVMAQNPGYYTVQLLSTLKEQPLIDFIHRNHLESTTAYYKKTHAGQTWHTLVYGAYPSTAEARAAIDNLPSSLREYEPWVQNISAAQQAIQQFRNHE